MKDIPTKILIFGVPGGGRSGQVGVKLALSWHLNGILKEVKFKTPIRSLGRGAREIYPPLREALGPPRGGDIGEGTIDLRIGS